MITTLLPRSAALRLLRTVIAAVGVYGLAMVCIGLVVADELFDRLGFGPADGGVTSDEARDYVQLMVAVVGAVIVGWMTTLFLVLRNATAELDRATWTIVTASVVVWFVVDTSASLALGWPTHALFNVAFIATLAVPLVALRPVLTDA